MSMNWCRGALSALALLALIGCGGTGGNDDVVAPAEQPPLNPAPPPVGDGQQDPVADPTPEPDPAPDPSPPPQPSATTTLSGIAALGAALDGATVTVRTGTGTLLDLGDIVTGNDGSYQIAIPADTPRPLLVTITPPGGAALRTVVPATDDPTAPVTANVNPITELVANQVVGAPSDDPTAIGGALASVADDPTVVDSAGEAVVGALLGGSIDYESFANDPDFVAATADGGEVPSVTDTLLDTLEQSADGEDKPLAQFLAEKLAQPNPPRLVEDPGFQVRYVGALVNKGNPPEEIEQRLTASGAITPLAEGRTTDVFRQAITAVPKIIAATSAATTSLDGSPRLKQKAVDAAVDALANLVDERKQRFGDGDDELEATLGSDAVVNTVTNVVATVVTPVLEQVALRTDQETVDDALDEVLEKTADAAGQTLSGFEPTQLQNADNSEQLSSAASSFLQTRVVSADTAGQLDGIASGTASATDSITKPADVTEAQDGIRTIVGEDSTLLEVPPGAWNVNDWNDFDWS